MATNANRLPCKCLSPLSDNELAPIYEIENASSIGNTSTVSSLSKCKAVCSRGEELCLWNHVIDAVCSFPNLTQKSINSFMEEARRSEMVKNCLTNSTQLLKCGQRMILPGLLCPCKTGGS